MQRRARVLAGTGSGARLHFRVWQEMVWTRKEREALGELGHKCPLENDE